MYPGRRLRQAQTVLVSVLVPVHEVGTHLVEALLLQAPPQNLADPRQSGDWFVSHGLADKVPMLLRCGGHPAGTNGPETEVSKGSYRLENWLFIA